MTQSRPPGTRNGFTMTEKIMARASGRASVRAGDFVSPTPDRVIIHDGYVGSAEKALAEAGFKRITNRERVMFVTDHDVIYADGALVLRGANIRRVAKEWQVGNFFDVGQGGHGHIFPMEAGLVQPGSFVFAYDPHCSTFGAVGSRRSAPSAIGAPPCLANVSLAPVSSQRVGKKSERSRKGVGKESEGVGKESERSRRESERSRRSRK